MVISISNGGYVKRLPVTTYRAQGRGGKGLRGVRLKDEDYIEHLFIASTHHYLLFFTNRGKVYRQKVHELPQGSRDSRGRHLANVLALLPGEEVRAVFATRDYSEGKYLVLATREGMVKKTELRSYDTVLRERGLAAIQLDEGDELVGVQVTDGDEDLLVVSARGQAARFYEGKVRAMGRDTRGVKAMNLDQGDRVLTHLRGPRRRGPAGRDRQRLRQAHRRWPTTRARAGPPRASARSRSATARASSSPPGRSARARSCC